MINRGAEDKACLTVLRLFDDLMTGCRHKTAFAHRFFYILRNELTGSDIQVVEIGIRRASFGRDVRYPSGIDQILDIRLVAYLIEEVFRFADKPTLSPEGCRRPADHPDIRILSFGGVQKGLISSLTVRRYHVNLINHHKLERFKEIDLVVDRLNTGHDDRFFRITPVETGTVNADRHFRAEPLKLLAVLIDQLFDVGENENAPTPKIHRIGGDRRDADRLAASRRNDYARIAILVSQIIVQRSLGFGLITS